MPVKPELTVRLAGVLGVGFKRFGSEEKLLADPIHHLYEVYVKVNRVMDAEKEAEKEKALAAGTKQVFPGLRTLTWILYRYNARVRRTLAEFWRQTSNGPTDDEARAFFARMEAWNPGRRVQRCYRFRLCHWRRNDCQSARPEADIYRID